MVCLFKLGILIGLCKICLTQSSSSSFSATSSATIVTVTSISTFAIIILPSSNSSSLSPSTTIPSTSSSLISISTTSSIVLPTTPYTGQAILTGTCNIPQYTALGLQDGAVIEVPLVGCSDDRPECCPSLSPPKSSPSTTPSPTLSGLAVTGVISMLSASPLSICPSAFIDLDPVCCPSGYSIYGQAVLGNTPCYSMLSTIVPIPSAVSNSITSAVAETASSATAIVSVIINQVFALGLPCADEPETGLSTGAKAGIGAGAGVGGLLIIGLIILAMVSIGKKQLKEREKARPTADTQDHKHISATTGKLSPYMGMGSPALDQPSSQFQPQMPAYSFQSNSAFGSNPPHGSWDSRPQSMQPQNQGSLAEMHVPVTHEIGDGQPVGQRGPFNVMSSTGSNAATSISAYSAQQRRME